MYEDSIQLIEIPDANLISVCVSVENDELFALGERIDAKFEDALMAFIEESQDAIEWN